MKKIISKSCVKTITFVDDEYLRSFYNSPIDCHLYTYKKAGTIYENCGLFSKKVKVIEYPHFESRGDILTLDEALQMTSKIGEGYHHHEYQHLYIANDKIMVKPFIEILDVDDNRVKVYYDTINEATMKFNEITAIMDSKDKDSIMIDIPN